MLGNHREHGKAAALRQWRDRHDAYVAMIDTARTFAGTTADGVLLGPGETAFLQIADTELVEERRGRGTYVGHSQGVSLPVARVGGRQIRYRVGATRGHYVQGEPTPTAVDTGTTTITSSRVVFRGAAQTRECAFAKLIGFDHDSASGSTTFSVSNRQKPTTLQYGPACAATVEFRLDLALAHFRGTVDEFVAGLEADLAAIDAERPADPGGAVGDVADVVVPPAPVADSLPPSAGSTHVPEADEADGPSGGPPPAGWYADPWRTAPLRWWDGSAWSWQVVDPAAPSGPT